MKKNISALLIVLCLVFALSSCGDAKTHKSFTFTVDTGDKISIELITTGGYDISSNLPFEISQNGTTLSQGIFIEAKQYESYVEAVNSDDSAKVIEASTKDSNQYVFWSYNDSEFNIVILVSDSNTGILLGNVVSEESARECFNRLTISLDKE